MNYTLEIATEADRDWLDNLRRAAYQELMVDTFGAWDEERHKRHCQQCWEQGPIQIVTVSGKRVGMIQLLDSPDTVELSEIEIHPNHQGKQIGHSLIADAISRAQKAGKDMCLSVALKNRRALKLYEELGFRIVGRTDSHFQMRL